jgi:UDP-N-acetylmuramate--alanine ligase
MMSVPGRHTIENAVAAAVASHVSGATPAQIKEALQSYKGVKRRFEFRIQGKNIVFIDDYAHHPQELKACIKTARELYPGKKILGVFQPHLFTRTRDLKEEFAAVLEELDSVILMPVYPARELPIPGVTSEMLLNRINKKEKVLSEKNELLKTISGQSFDVLITMGAGDIDQWVEPIEKLLRGKNKQAAK